MRALLAARVPPARRVRRPRTCCPSTSHTRDRAGRDRPRTRPETRGESAHGVLPRAPSTRPLALARDRSGREASVLRMSPGRPAMGPYGGGGFFAPPVEPPRAAGGGAG